MRPSRLLALLALGLAPLLSAPLGAKTTVPADASPEQLAANAAAEATGELLYRLDQAAWRATDAYQAAGGPNAAFPLGGYLTEELPSGQIAVTFYTTIAGRNYELQRFTVEGEQATSPGEHAAPQDFPLSPLLERMVRARDAAVAEAVAQKVTLCAPAPANVVILPPDEADLIAVYLLTPPMVPGQYPMAGHYKFLVDAADKVVGARRFQDGCLDAPIIPPGISPAVAPENFQLAHVLDDHPTEIHHLVAHYINLPLAVATGNQVWTIDDRAPPPASAP